MPWTDSTSSYLTEHIDVGTSWSQLCWHFGSLPLVLRKRFCFPASPLWPSVLVVSLSDARAARGSSAQWRESRAEMCLLCQHSRVQNTHTYTHTTTPTCANTTADMQKLKETQLFGKQILVCTHLLKARTHTSVSLLPLQLLSSPLVPLVEVFDIASKPGFLWPALMLVSSCLVIFLSSFSPLFPAFPFETTCMLGATVPNLFLPHSVLFLPSESVHYPLCPLCFHAYLI